MLDAAKAKFGFFFPPNNEQGSLLRRSKALQAKFIARKMILMHMPQRFEIPKANMIT